MKTKKFLTNLYSVFLVWFLIPSMLMGCGTVEAGTVQSEPDNSNVVGIEPTPLPERFTYTNDTYAFAFDYPKTWTLTEQDHGVVLQRGTNRLRINFRRADEQIDQFGLMGMGAGDRIDAGKVNFMNQAIPFEALSFENATKAVFYGESGLVETGDLVFLITLEDLETDYMDVNLSEDIITEAGMILETFRLLDTSTDIESSTESSGLEAHLNIQDSTQQGSGEPIIVHFLLENHTQEGLYLLKWYTPLEGIGGDVFEVTRDGQLIPYMGPMVSRTVPTPESYIFVEPGKGVTAEVDIGAAYDFSKPGIYTIQYRSPRISHLALSEAEMATSFDELGPVDIPSNEVILEVVASSPGM